MYDYRLEDAGISSTEDDEDEDENSKQVPRACRGLGGDVTALPEG